MNRWTCSYPECPAVCVGVAGAVGLRAVGWFFERGAGPFCPLHRPDAGGDDCSHCIAEVWAFRYQAAIEPTMSHVPVLVLDHAKHYERLRDTPTAR